MRKWADGAELSEDLKFEFQIKFIRQIRSNLWEFDFNYQGMSKSLLVTGIRQTADSQDK